MRGWVGVFVCLFVLLFGGPSCSTGFTPADPGFDAGIDTTSSVDAATDTDHANHDPGTCETVGRTGGTDTCLLFAYCGHRHFQIDCAARFTCICSEPEVDGGAAKEIVAEPTFCESPSTDLKAAFDAAGHACGW
jgi:hypothetical protein